MHVCVCVGREGVNTKANVTHSLWGHSDLKLGDMASKLLALPTHTSYACVYTWTHTHICIWTLYRESEESDRSNLILRAEGVNIFDRRQKKDVEDKEEWKKLEEEEIPGNMKKEKMKENSSQLHWVIVWMLHFFWFTKRGQCQQARPLSRCTWSSRWCRWIYFYFFFVRIISVCIKQTVDIYSFSFFF